MTTTDHMTEAQALTVLNRLKAEGFTSGFDCAAVCLDGYHGQRSKRWGEPKSARYAVSFTALGDMHAAAVRALGAGGAQAGHGSSYWVFEFKPEWATNAR